MHKLGIGALALVALAGCMSNNKPQTNHYSYQSQEHSGEVSVADTWYGLADGYCANDWREQPLMARSGLPVNLTVPFEFTFDVISQDEDGSIISEQTFSAPAFTGLGDQVYLRDYQATKQYMLETETHGILQQGDFFFYPAGFVLRMSKPAVVGNVFKACIGLDHTYVLDDDLEASTEPTVHLDRLVVPLAMERGDGDVTFYYGTHIKHTVKVRAPK